MLDALRKGAGTWVAKLFIALLIFSFAVWGISGFLTGVARTPPPRSVTRKSPCSILIGPTGRTSDGWLNSSAGR